MKTIEQIIRDDIGQGGPQLPSDECEQRIDNILGQMNCAELLTRISNAVAEIGGGSGMRLVYSGPVSALRSSTKEAPPATVFYTNYRGETSERTITPIRPWFGSTEWHPEPQWLLRAYDHNKGAERDFALKDLGRKGPSAARELALEEVTLERSIERWRDMKPSEVMKGSTAQITYALEDARKDILSLARALSSPDHADAGKVEGDGWLPIESAPKDETLFLAYCPADEDFPDGRMMIWKGSIFAFQKNPTPNHLQFPATHWRPLPSAPASEGAE